MTHIFDQLLTHTWGPLFEKGGFGDAVGDNDIEWWKIDKLYPSFEENSEIETHFFALVQYIREKWCKMNKTISWISVYWVDETKTDVFVEFYSQLFDGKMNFKISKDGIHFILDKHLLCNIHLPRHEH